MVKPTYICLNGEFRQAAQPSLLTANRAFRFGDSIIEQIHACSTEAQLLEYHYSRMIRGLDLLGMIVPERLNYAGLARFITQLLNRNKMFGGACIRLTLFRNQGESMPPGGADASFLLESEALLSDRYALNEKGYVIDICPDYRRQTGVLSAIKTSNSLPDVMTAMFCRQNSLDDAVMMNEAGRITGSYRSNIFLVSGSSVFTPGTEQGAFPGIIREVILKLASRSGLRINEQSSLTPAVLDDADEVFFTNAVEGIRWAGAYKQRRYYKKTALMLIRKLNEMVFDGQD
jgi:branched-subunit amino acid aminotransferase/4-amino-4-deoxychorismate lyase